jgi:peptidoglycan/LPS O-acetylase OafA/YrhL
MFSLDRSKNDTSVMLDLLRAVAAQMVCVGHAINLGGLGNTAAPSIGVLIFFILSGFVIAYTLKSKTDRGDYSLSRYAIERICRIYCAYLPAILLIGGAHLLATWGGLEFKNIDKADLQTYIANLFMLQMYPMHYGFATFGTAGQLSSIAQEFHIYFFVGSLYFFCIGRQRIVAALVAVISPTMPLSNFLAIQGRALFLLWLIGFTIYFVVRSIKIDKEFAVLFVITAAGILYYGRPFRDAADVYDIANFPALALVFAALVIVTQCYRLLAASDLATKIIHVFASYSLTLFLLHLTIIRVIYAIWYPSVWVAAGAIGVANVFSIALAFSPIGEIHYKRLAEWMAGLFRSPIRSVAPAK